MTSNKVKNGTLKPKDLKKPTYVQSINLAARHSAGGARRHEPGAVRLHPPDEGPDQRHRVHPDHQRRLRQRQHRPPTIGLYIDNVPVAGTAATVPAPPNDRSVQLTATLELGGAPTRAGSASPARRVAAQQPDLPGRKSWTIIQAD